VPRHGRDRERIATLTVPPLTAGRCHARERGSIAAARWLLVPRRMQYSPRFVLAFTCLLAACADDEPATFTADDFVAPATTDDVEELYAQLGTCNDSFLTRSLTPRLELTASTLWTPPATAPAGLMAWQTNDRWGTLLLPSELTFDGVGEDVNNADPACDAVRRLLTPIRDAASGREQLTHALLYLDEPAHPYDSFPDGGIEALRVETPVALESYLAVLFAKREIDGSTVSFSDITEQHLPMYMSCAKPLAIETTAVMFDAGDLELIDRAMCDAGTDIDGDGDLDHLCVAERGTHVADNTCTFVVDASNLQLLDGRRVPAIFGGTIATLDGLRYALTVDRFSR
jgi:hypothetical protein